MCYNHCSSSAKRRGISVCNSSSPGWVSGWQLRSTRALGRGGRNLKLHRQSVLGMWLQPRWRFLPSILGCRRNTGSDGQCQVAADFTLSMCEPGVWGLTPSSVATKWLGVAFSSFQVLFMVPESSALRHLQDTGAVLKRGVYCMDMSVHSDSSPTHAWTSAAQELSSRQLVLTVEHWDEGLLVVHTPPVQTSRGGHFLPSATWNRLFLETLCNQSKWTMALLHSFISPNIALKNVFN